MKSRTSSRWAAPSPSPPPPWSPHGNPSRLRTPVCSSVEEEEDSDRCGGQWWEISSSISPLSHYPSKITSISVIIVTISDERPCCAPPPCWRSHNPRLCRLTMWKLPRRPCKRCQRDDGEDNVVCCLFWTFLCGKSKKCRHGIYCQCCQWQNTMKYHLLSKLALFWILSHLFQNDDEAEIGL